MPLENTDAIREDVPGATPQANADTSNPNDDTGGQERPAYVNPRVAAMDMIAAQRNASFAAESGVDPTADAATPPDPDPAPDRPAEPAAQPNLDSPQQLADQLAADDSVIDESMLQRRVRLKIDGKDELVPLEQLVRGAQKLRAADARLNEATQILRKAKAGELQLAGGETPATNPPTPAQDPSALRATVTASVKDALGNVFNGNEDEAVAKLVDAVLAATAQPTSAPPPQLDISEVTRSVKSELDRESALAAFAKAYPRIIDDPDLPVVADATIARIQAEEGLSFEAALDKAGRNIYGRFGWEVPGDARAANPNSRPTTERTQQVATRKAGLDVPTGRMVSAAGVAVAPESSEQNRSQTIAEMAASRTPNNLAGRTAARR